MPLIAFLQTVITYIHALITAGWQRAIQSANNLLGLNIQPSDLNWDNFKVSFLYLDTRTRQGQFVVGANA